MLVRITLTNGGQINIDSEGTGSGGNALNVDSLIVSGSGFNNINGNTGSNTPDGVLNINSGGTFDLMGAGTTTFNGLTLFNEGTINQALSANDLRLNNDTILTNNGTYDLQNDLGMVITSGGGVFFNNGTFQKTGGAGTSVISVGFDNFSGLISQTSGNIHLNAGGSFNGTSVVENASGTLAITNLLFTFVDGVIFDDIGGGPGDLDLDGVTVDIAGDLALANVSMTNGSVINVDTDGSVSSGDTLTVDNLLIDGSGFNTINGNSGSNSPAGILDISSGQILTMTDGGVVTFNGLAINNAGTINQSLTANDLRLNNGSVINNSGTYDLQNDLGITETSGSGTFINTGVIQKTGGTGTSVINVGFDNIGGSIFQSTGNIGLNAGGSFDSITTVDNLGGILVLSGGGFTFFDGALYEDFGGGPGDLDLDGVTVDIAGDLALANVGMTNGTVVNVDTDGSVSSGDTLTVDNLLIDGSGFNTINGNSGSNSPAGILDIGSGQILTMTDGGVVTFNGLAINNAGTINQSLTANDLRLNNGSVINNSGTYDLQK